MIFIIEGSKFKKFAGSSSSSRLLIFFSMFFFRESNFREFVFVPNKVRDKINLKFLDDP